MSLQTIVNGYSNNSMLAGIIQQAVVELTLHFVSSNSDNTYSIMEDTLQQYQCTHLKYGLPGSPSGWMKALSMFMYLSLMMRTVFSERLPC